MSPLDTHPEIAFSIRISLIEVNC